MKANKIISQRRIKRIKAQGYFNFSNYEIAQLAFGNRFAYILCTSILFVAIVTANITLLSIILIIAFSAVVLPNHPFDYLYNYIIRHIIRRPKLPTRSKQLKFACSLATCFIALTIYLFDYGYTLAGYIVGGNLLFIATLVSISDICIPSIIYNKVFIEKTIRQNKAFKRR